MMSVFGLEGGAHHELPQLRQPWCDVEVSTMQCGASPSISLGDGALPFETVRTAGGPFGSCCQHRWCGQALVIIPLSAITLEGFDLGVLHVFCRAHTRDSGKRDDNHPRGDAASLEPSGSHVPPPHFC